jgi:phage replication O-like protein O
MANPQKENGFTPIANELLEAFYRCKLLEYERCVVMCIWRKTYGWNKKEDWVSNSQIFEETGIVLPNITRTIKSLVAKKILIKNGKLVAVNKNYEEWVVEWRRLSHQITKVISPDNQKLSHQIPTKEKRNYTKEISEQSSVTNQNDMSFKNMRKYNEDGHWEEPAIDADTGREPEPEVDYEAEAQKELMQKVRHNVRLAFGAMKFPQKDAKTINWHSKHYVTLLNRGWSHEQIVSELINIVDSDVWKEKMENGEYPGMNTVEYNLRNKDPKKYVIS